jgi:RNase H-like domain found in reverse transcriptase
MSRQVTLAYPDDTKPFYIHTDASQFQLGGIISQENQPLAFYSC